MEPNIKLYTLSTCTHCKNAKKFFNDCKAEYTFVDVDLLKGQDRKAIMEEIRKLSSEISFPIIVIGNKVIVGFNENEVNKAMGIL